MDNDNCIEDLKQKAKDVYYHIMHIISDEKEKYCEAKHKCLNPIDYIKAEAAEKAIVNLYEELEEGI